MLCETHVWDSAQGVCVGLMKQNDHLQVASKQALVGSCKCWLDLVGFGKDALISLIAHGDVEKQGFPLRTLLQPGKCHAPLASASRLGSSTAKRGHNPQTTSTAATPSKSITRRKPLI